MNYCLIGEVKHRKTTKFSLSEAEAFVAKAEELCRLEQLEKYLLFVFSSCGFTGKALDYFKTNGMAWSDDQRWLEKD